MLIPNSKALLSNVPAQISKLIALAWYVLRSPKTTGGLWAILALVVGLSLIIPQQSSLTPSDAARAAWIARLPASLQVEGNLLFSLGFSDLRQSLWLWLPLGLLLLNSLIALADYLPGSRRRLGLVSPSLNWQHPLAQRAEYSIRLPESPDKYLEALKESLKTKGFYLYESNATDLRPISTARWRWSWLGPVAFYAGLIGLVLALLVSHYFLQFENLTLLPLEPRSSSLFKGEFTLNGIDAGGVGSVSYLAAKTDPAPSLLTWRLYQPTFFAQTLILPRAVDPILTIEVRDGDGTRLRLIPSQENLLPAEQLHLPLDEANSPLYFLIPSVGLAFQILPNSSHNDTFKVQVRRNSELAPATEITAQAGQAFDVEGLAITLSLNSSIRLIAYRDPALPLYLLSLVLIATSLLVFWRPPLQVWLIPEVKGRGGQLYGVVEKFGSVAEVPHFLDQLLAGPDLPAGAGQSEEKDINNS